MFVLNGIKVLNGKINLAKELAEHIRNFPNMTVDEFYDKFNIEKSVRSDFATAALLSLSKQYS